MAASSCPQCGNVYAADSVFCRKCGHKRELPIRYLPAVQQTVMEPASVTVASAVGAAAAGTATVTPAVYMTAPAQQVASYPAVAQPASVTVAPGPVTYSAPTPASVTVAQSPVTYSAPPVQLPPVQMQTYSAAAPAAVAPMVAPTTTYSPATSYAPAPIVAGQVTVAKTIQTPAMAESRSTRRPELEHRVIGERRITREELAETGNLVEMEGTVVPSSDTRKSSLLAPREVIREDPFLPGVAPSVALHGGISTLEPQHVQTVQTYSVPAQAAAVYSAPPVQTASPVYPLQGGDLMTAFDSNHDGVISREEFAQGLARISASAHAGGSACPACGNIYAADSNFCRKCGRPRDQGMASMSAQGQLSAEPLAVI
eukprot:TRINITY_DN9989_c0_g1_i2.p1 TRINITY_DN9989_c0_g1~~TRINITY_DN9989_c0_g1_i2.p1  ORF type:complete len:420 (+),score=53.33 TRINITY_DN9989_c0_g1_i2:150-1262(+)